MEELVLLGDEALAMGAVHAGLSAAYGYPGTPSTEIIEYLQGYSRRCGAKGETAPIAQWCANEKTAYEDALGASFVGKRALVTMKHVGLNVASDAFVNSALLDIQGGLVLAVADDPGMHSSQDEQDSRFYAEFAGVPCLEPRNQQEAYDMTLEAFELSERHHVPVMIRLVTRLAHSRAVVRMGSARAQNPLSKPKDKSGWMLLPALARRNYKRLIEKQAKFLAESEASPYNQLSLNPRFTEYAIVTTGLGGNYYEELIEELGAANPGAANPGAAPSRLHIARYPAPEDKLRKIAASAKRVIVIEEGNPFVEKALAGILPHEVKVEGKLTGLIPKDGELNPDIVRKALGLKAREGLGFEAPQIPGRPPQLCAGCPHLDSYAAIKEAISSFPESVVTSDIGCYALGALPPYSVPETIVCMGASVGMAKGAAEAGFHPVIGVIGDSTFLHSGVTSLMDCAMANANMTLVIVDNETVGMTGGQKTILPSSRLTKVVEAVGVDPAHIKIWDAHRRSHEANVASLKEEMAYKGLSVIISVRECIETGKKKAKAGCAE